MVVILKAQKTITVMLILEYVLACQMLLVKNVWNVILDITIIQIVKVIHINWLVEMKTLANWVYN